MAKRPCDTGSTGGNNVTGGISYDSLLGANGLFGKVEGAGYTVDGVIAAMTGRAAMRGIKDDAGRPIFVTDMQGATRYALDGAPMYFPANGAFDPSVAQMVAGNWKQLVFAIRQDIQTKILTEGVIQDPESKAIVYNLAQQDMIALRVTFRMGWALPNPATRLKPRPRKRPVCLHRSRYTPLPTTPPPSPCRTAKAPQSKARL